MLDVQEAECGRDRNKVSLPSITYPSSLVKLGLRRRASAFDTRGWTSIKLLAFEDGRKKKHISLKVVLMSRKTLQLLQIHLRCNQRTKVRTSS